MEREPGWYWVMDDSMRWYPCYFDTVWNLDNDFNVNDTFFRKIDETKLKPPTDE